MNSSDLYKKKLFSIDWGKLSLRKDVQLHLEMQSKGASLVVLWLATTRESPRTATKTQQSQNFKKFKKETLCHSAHFLLLFLSFSFLFLTKNRDLFCDKFSTSNKTHGCDPPSWGSSAGSQTLSQVHCAGWVAKDGPSSFLYDLQVFCTGSRDVD